jgi:hypothetical protein
LQKVNSQSRKFSRHALGEGSLPQHGDRELSIPAVAPSHGLFGALEDARRFEPATKLREPLGRRCFVGALQRRQDVGDEGASRLAPDADRPLRR